MRSTRLGKTQQLRWMGEFVQLVPYHGPRSFHDTGTCWVPLTAYELLLQPLIYLIARDVASPEK